jgi:hypothetical protein
MKPQRQLPTGAIEYGHFGAAKITGQHDSMEIE